MKTINKYKIAASAFVFAGFFIFSCSDGVQKDKKVLGKVYDNYLYLEDIAHTIPDDISPEDSSEIVRNKTDLWVRKQLLLNQANAGLSPEQKDVEQIVKDYRASLLIDKYKQEFLKQKLDTFVDKSDIRAYYQNNTESFLLSRPIIKGFYVKIPLDHKQFREIRDAALSNADDAEKLVAELAENSNFQFVNFPDEWVPFSEYADRMPQNTARPKAPGKSTNYIIQRDDQFLYILRIDESKNTGEPMPFEQARDQIKILILNKQKTELLNALERSIYQNALQTGHLELFYTE